jgi:hypothetical protein
MQNLAACGALPFLEQTEGEGCIARPHACSRSSLARWPWGLWAAFAVGGAMVATVARPTLGPNGQSVGQPHSHSAQRARPTALHRAINRPPPPSICPPSLRASLHPPSSPAGRPTTNHAACQLTALHACTHAWTSVRRVRSPAHTPHRHTPRTPACVPGRARSILRHTPPHTPPHSPPHTPPHTPHRRTPHTFACVPGQARSKPRHTPRYTRHTTHPHPMCGVRTRILGFRVIRSLGF